MARLLTIVVGGDRAHKNALKTEDLSFFKEKKIRVIFLNPELSQFLASHVSSRFWLSWHAYHPLAWPPTLYCLFWIHAEFSSSSSIWTGGEKPRGSIAPTQVMRVSWSARHLNKCSGIWKCTLFLRPCCVLLSLQDPVNSLAPDLIKHSAWHASALVGAVKANPSHSNP